MSLSLYSTIATALPWNGNRETYSQRSYPYQRTSSEPYEELKRSLNKTNLPGFFKKSGIELTNNPKSFYQNLNKFLDEKITSTIASSESKKGEFKSSKTKYKYTGQLNKAGKFESENSSCLVEYKNEADIESVYFGSFKDGVPRGTGIKRNQDGLITIAEFSKGIEKANILTINPSALIIFQDKVTLKKQVKNKLEKEASQTGRIIFPDSEYFSRTSFVINPSGASYSGSFNQEKVSRSSGRFTEPHRTYVGSFYGSNTIQKGELENSFKIKELGEFDEQSGYLHGEGSKRFPNQEHIKGSWQAGIAEGNFDVTYNKNLKLRVYFPPKWQPHHSLSAKIDIANKFTLETEIKLEKPSPNTERHYLDDYLVTYRVSPVKAATLTEKKTGRKIKIYWSDDGKLVSAKSLDGIDEIDIEIQESLSKNEFDIRKISQNHEIFSLFSSKAKSGNDFDKLHENFAWLKDLRAPQDNHREYQIRLKKILEAQSKLQIEARNLLENKPANYLCNQLTEDKGTEKERTIFIYYPKKAKDPRKASSVVGIVADPADKTKAVALFKGALNANYNLQGRGIYISCKYLNKNSLDIDTVSIGNFEDGWLDGENCQTYQCKEKGCPVISGAFRRSNPVNVEEHKMDGSYFKGNMRFNKKGDRTESGIFVNAANGSYSKQSLVNGHANGHFSKYIPFAGGKSYLIGEIHCSDENDECCKLSGENIKIQDDVHLKTRLINGRLDKNSPIEFLDKYSKFQGNISSPDPKSIGKIIEYTKANPNEDLEGPLLKYFINSLKNGFVFWASRAGELEDLSKQIKAKGNFKDALLHDQRAEISLQNETGETIKLIGDFKRGKLTRIVRSSSPIELSKAKEAIGLVEFDPFKLNETLRKANELKRASSGFGSLLNKLPNFFKRS